MERLTLRFAIALLTFALGIVSERLCHVQRLSTVRQIKEATTRRIKGDDISDVENDDQDCPPAFEGCYSNYDYAYSVKVPRGMIGFGACVTNHGFGIDLT